MVELSTKNQKAINRELINVVNRYRENPEEGNLKWIFTKLVPIISSSIWSKHSVQLRQSGIEYDDVIGIVSCRFYECIKEDINKFINAKDKNVFNYWYTMAHWAIQNEVKLLSRTNTAVTITVRSIRKTQEQYEEILNKVESASVNSEKEYINKIYASETIQLIKEYVNNNYRFSDVERVVFNWALENEFDFKDELWNQKVSETDRKKIYNIISNVRKKIKTGFRRTDLVYA